MNNKQQIKTKENNENLCPTIRKRVSSRNNVHSSGWKLAKLETASSPSSLTSTYLEEMGIGVLDSEESSSSTASNITLGLCSSTGENTNQATPNLDASKISHHARLTYHNMENSLLDVTTDNSHNHNSNLQLNDAKMAEQQHKYSNSNILNLPAYTGNDIAADEHQPNSISNCLISEKSVLLQSQQSNKTVRKKSQERTIPSVNSATNGSPNITRSPLATVACHSFTRNSQHKQEVAANDFLPSSLSPSSQPSTSQQAALNNVPRSMECCRQQQTANVQEPEVKLTTTTECEYQPEHKIHKIHSLTPVTGIQENCPLNCNDFMCSNRHHPHTNYFNQLSDEIILHIMKWLPKKALLRCGYVCRRFHRCASDESLWSRLDLGGRSLRAGAMEHVLKRGVVVLRLAQTEINEPIYDNLRIDFEAKLQYLDLSMAAISKTSLKYLLGCCRNLRKLSLEHVALNDEICMEIAQNTHLEILNLAMCSGLEAWSVRKVMSALKNLSSLNISWTNLSVDAVTSLVSNITPNIMRLNVAGCRKTMFDSHLSSLCHRCPQLLELDLSDCTGLTSSAIPIICKFPMLEYLSLSRCYLISAAAYIELRNLSTLTYLDIFGMLTDSALAVMEQTFSHIGINKFIHSSVARPTVGTKRTSIWGLRTRD